MYNDYNKPISAKVVIGFICGALLLAVGIWRWLSSYSVVSSIPQIKYVEESKTGLALQDFDGSAGVALDKTPTLYWVVMKHTRKNGETFTTKHKVTQVEWDQSAAVPMTNKEGSKVEKLLDRMLD